jgi:hypothetical protein
MAARRVESLLLFMVAFFTSHAITMLIQMIFFDAREYSPLADFMILVLMLGG